MPPSVDYYTLDAAAEAVGDSYYIADVERLKTNLFRFLKAFQTHWPNTSVGYSYKTNYLREFILAAMEVGAYSEVVSELEYRLARRHEIAPAKVIVNGPVKQGSFLEEALVDGAIVNLDSLQELDDALSIARRQRGERIRIGLRCALPGTRTRFGIDVSDPETIAHLRRVVSDDLIDIVALHAHHSGERNIERFRSRISSLIHVHQNVLPNAPIERLNAGGGFSSPMSSELASQMTSRPPSYEEYGEAMADVLKAAYGSEGPELTLEPGIAVLANTMRFVTRVVRTKVIQQRNLAVADGSIFCTMPLRGDVELPVEVFRPPRQEVGVRRWSIVGHTCMEIDVLRKSLDADLAPGDMVAFDNVGAYSTVLAPTFIRSEPAVIDGGALPSVSLLRTGTTETSMT
jgi:diaminopimelate decarboxylase